MQFFNYLIHSFYLPLFQAVGYVVVVCGIHQAVGATVVYLQVFTSYEIGFYFGDVVKGFSYLLHKFLSVLWVRHSFAPLWFVGEVFVAFKTVESFCFVAFGDIVAAYKGE